MLIEIQSLINVKRLREPFQHKHIHLVDPNNSCIFFMPSLLGD